jgi:CRISPR/Cas system CSM-associated protein Csm4 (group 5 of RAMP superfamily)
LIEVSNKLEKLKIEYEMQLKLTVSLESDLNITRREKEEIKEGEYSKQEQLESLRKEIDLAKAEIKRLRKSEEKQGKELLDKDS